MISQVIPQYDSPHQFEPLLPSAKAMAPLLERAADLTSACASLGVAVGQGPWVELRGLLRRMNSFYTNLIEGEHTRPSDIDRALLLDFSNDKEIARKQRLALAHIGVEEAFEAQLDEREREAGQQDAWLYQADTLCGIHGALFKDLPAEDLRLKDDSLMEPGRLRTRQVSVGRHEGPLHSAVPAFLARWSAVYASARRGESTLVAIAAAHHRLAWIHPFLDGNGRVSRLHTHLCLYATGLTKGLWSPLRGFARSQDRYRALLAAADEHRHGDLDGRGNLSQAALVDWMAYVLDTCVDQARFMAEQLDVRHMKDRLAACLHYEDAVVGSGVKPQALLPLHHLFATNEPLARADFKAMSTLGDRQATQLISDMLREGFLKTASPYGPLSFGIPNRALRFYFPALWPEAEQDEAAMAGADARSPMKSNRRTKRR
ncbi:MAG TPA: Fic family protein [Hydrogenophaga sp.]|uniref:Fic family protein n=1 Tax=Hydrogenophaga sp. TaxID=1904254 RepID=UPI002C1911E9|nr:Fic family protein [Hydrogenophaga sp.]HSX92168.1 Fic family protein [Hydrogenophaga sp.]